MDLRNQVKSVLRQCGHAALGTIHDRLTGIESTLQRIVEQNTHTARTQTALLQSAVHLVENMAQVHAEIAEAERRIRDLLEEEVIRRVWAETGEYAALRPEVALLEFLYSYVPSRLALDIGAHRGDVSECLLRAGYEVYAFEPAPDVYDKLKTRLEGRPDFHSFRFALGSVEGEAMLHLATDLSAGRYYPDPTLLSSLITHSMPDDIPYTHTVPVAVRTLADLHRAGTVPEDIGVVKIATEGFDLEVVRGMGTHRYPVVLTEYFDVRHPFGQSGLPYTLDGLIHEMRIRGYLWHIVVHRDWQRKRTAYYCNHDRAVSGTCGSVCFFRDRSTFSQAESWCSAVLPRTYFRPERSPDGTGVK